MSIANPRKMTVSEFLSWEAKQDEKWELVDGYPVLRRTRLMAGGTLNHALIATNIISALRPRLRGGPCAPLPADIKAASPTGSVRYPDVTVDCSKGAGKELVAPEPRVLFEVLSPSNTYFSQTRLLGDYQAIEAAAHVVFISQTTAFAEVWTRQGEGWRRSEVAGLSEDLALPALGVSIPMTEVYEGVELEPEAGDAPPPA